MRLCRAIETTALRLRVGSDPEAGFESASTAARTRRTGDLDDHSPTHLSRNRHVTLIGLGNVLAQTQFKDQRSRAPRQHHDVALPTTAATQFGDPLADLTPMQLADFAAGL